MIQPITVTPHISRICSQLVCYSQKRASTEALCQEDSKKKRNAILKIIILFLLKTLMIQEKRVIL